jgi:hypothetical protein
VLKRIFGPKRKVVGSWRRLHIQELHNLYASQNIVRVIKSRRVVHVACMGDMRNAYKVLARKPEGKRPLGRARHRWENNIGMDHGETSYVFVG